MSVSADLVWMLTKNHNSKLYKNKVGNNHTNYIGRRTHGAAFSAEAGNLTNLNTFSASGFANKKTIDVNIAKNGKIVIGLKTKGARKVSTAKTTLRTHMANDKCKAAATIKQLTKKSFYRADKTTQAVARYHALNRGTQAVKVRHRPLSPPSFSCAVAQRPPPLRRHLSTSCVIFVQFSYIFLLILQMLLSSSRRRSFSIAPAARWSRDRVASDLSCPSALTLN
jgi:hypothetical protein